MTKLFVIFFLIIVEIIAIVAVIFTGAFSMTTYERELWELQNNLFLFLGGRLLFGIITSSVISFMVIGIYYIVTAATQISFYRNTVRLLFFQWVILFAIWLTLEIIDIVDVLSYKINSDV